MAEEKNDSKQPKKKNKALSVTLSIVKWFFIVLAALLILLIVFRDIIIEAAVENVGDYIVGTDINIEDFDTSLTGRVELHGFTVANPEGYHSANAFKLDEVIVDIDISSLFTDKIKINQIRVDGMHVDYELGWGKSNLSEISDNISRATKKAEAEKSGVTKTEEEKKAEEQETIAEEIEANEAEKSVEITELAIVNNSISFSNNTLGVSLNLPLGGIIMHDIGKESDTSMAEAINEVFSQIFASVISACSSAGSAVGGVVTDVVDSVKSLF